MKSRLFIPELVAFMFLAFCQNTLAIDNEIPIWPGDAPGSDGLIVTESIVDRDLSGTCTENRAIVDVVSPSIIPFVPDTPNGTAVIICPGGAYQRVVYDVEGVGIAEMFNELGVTAFVLKYRLPINDHVNKEDVPLQDAQRAMRYVKNFAANWDIDTSKIGIMGCSAGGHAAASLATDFDKEVYAAIDTVDELSARPSFLIELYPVISMEPTITHTGTRDALIGSSPTQDIIDEFSAEKHVTSSCPPAFFARAADDGSVKAANSILFVNALKEAGVPARLNTYLNGGHGKGICKASGTDFIRWVNDCKVWLDSLNLVTYEASGDATLKDLLVSNETIENFHKDTLDYYIELEAGSTGAPFVKAVVNQINAVAVVTRATDLPGTTTIDVTAHDGLTKRQYKIHFTIAATTSIHKIKKASFNVFPNPAKDNITIEIEGNSNGAIISIHAINGSLLIKQNILPGQHSTELDLKNLTQGAYIIKLGTDETIQTMLISKE